MRIHQIQETLNQPATCPNPKKYRKGRLDFHAFTARVVLPKPLPRLFPESPGVAAAQLLPRPPKPWQVGAIGWASPRTQSRANDHRLTSILQWKAIAGLPLSQTAVVVLHVLSLYFREKHVFCDKDDQDQEREKSSASMGSARLTVTGTS